MNLHSVCAHCGEHSLYVEMLGYIGITPDDEFACPICGDLYVS